MALREVPRSIPTWRGPLLLLTLLAPLREVFLAVFFSAMGEGGFETEVGEDAALERGGDGLAVGGRAEARLLGGVAQRGDLGEDGGGLGVEEDDERGRLGAPIGRRAGGHRALLDERLLHGLGQRARLLELHGRARPPERRVELGHGEGTPVVLRVG